MTLPTLVDAEAADTNVAPLGEVIASTKLRVLVVDDNVDAAESLAELVSIYGHESRVATSGASALAIVREFKPALVLLDIGMPGMNGYETARRIRAEDPSGQVTLAALTGWGAESDRIKAAEAGFDHHFTKPVEPAKVNDVLHKIARSQPKLATDLRHFRGDEHHFRWRSVNSLAPATSANDLVIESHAGRATLPCRPHVDGTINISG